MLPSPPPLPRTPSRSPIRTLVSRLLRLRAGGGKGRRAGRRGSMLVSQVPQACREAGEAGRHISFHEAGRRPPVLRQVGIPHRGPLLEQHHAGAAPKRKVAGLRRRGKRMDGHRRRGWAQVAPASKGAAEEGWSKRPRLARNCCKLQSAGRRAPPLPARLTSAPLATSCPTSTVQRMLPTTCTAQRSTLSSTRFAAALASESRAGSRIVLARPASKARSHVPRPTARSPAKHTRQALMRPSPGSPASPQLPAWLPTSFQPAGGLTVAPTAT